MSALKEPREAVEWRLFDDAAAMALRAADHVQSVIGSAIAARRAAVVALPGGRTPVPIFGKLAGRDLDWPLVTCCRPTIGWSRSTIRSATPG